MRPQILAVPMAMIREETPIPMEEESTRPGI